MISPGLAPKAACSAMSERRREARASKSPATLAHAISSTRATAENSIRKAGRVSPISWSSNGLATAAARVLFESGNCLARLLAITSRSALALASEASGLRRPITSKTSALRCFKELLIIAERCPQQAGRVLDREREARRHHSRYG